MKVLTKVLLFALVAMFLVPAASFAESLVRQSYTNRGAFDLTLDGQDKKYSTGEFGTLILDDNGVPINDGEVFTAFCVDPWQGAIGDKKAPVVFEMVEPSDYTRGLELAWLFDTYYKEDSTKEQIAGLQLALWEVIVDVEVDDLTTGNFTVTGGNAQAIAFATSYLENLPTTFSSEDIAYLNSAYEIAAHGNKQDWIIKVGEPVPEPATMLLLGFGLMGVVGLSRKYRK